MLTAEAFIKFEVLRQYKKTPSKVTTLLELVVLNILQYCTFHWHCEFCIELCIEEMHCLVVVIFLFAFGHLLAKISAVDVLLWLTIVQLDV